MKQQMVRSSSKQRRDRIIFLLFFLPVPFILFDWLRREAVCGWRSALFVAAMAFAVLVNSFVYDFKSKT
jgi:hypothetical protein